jgi:hypothetical protein
MTAVYATLFFTLQVLFGLFGFGKDRISFGLRLLFIVPFMASCLVPLAYCMYYRVQWPSIVWDILALSVMGITMARWWNRAPLPPGAEQE